jgi:hypothetical protein
MSAGLVVVVVVGDVIVGWVGEMLGRREEVRKGGEMGEFEDIGWARDE